MTVGNKLRISGSFLPFELRFIPIHNVSLLSCIGGVAPDTYC
ncbi:protein of unknown function [Shewanella benthica]|uniref:Uncharacterized protein n=1 Tax=Shewanella benthica TaxID=43661 RepID=A0A330M6H9_9GAMM|nr:protein of unknown function [Shewanella benthica]